MVTKANWIRHIAIVLIPSLLIAAYLVAKPHETKPKAPDDRLQWSAKATAYTPLKGTPRAPEGLAGAARRLFIPPDSLDASLQVSIRLKPSGRPDSPSVNPSGSGTLTVRGVKYSFLVDSTSTLSRFRLADGSFFVRGPLDIVITTPDGEQRATLGVGSVVGTQEGTWTYTNTDGQGSVLFGNGYSAAHTDDIAAKQ
ncbi:hypothetical protein SD70_21990 [Gordoniibacillus kamchatkensis]|uniref:LPS export ABC transporter periplasmic protein LptC n=1 Tax=Gordoniibacillus kamchatkensis TaxID=1590651 RepID=A0ABR5ADM1_9BACL|nr:hypothetical protein [Paenibacillus sp. VKM B-2647]KIL39109.1 hypothetical protein SD70_21990 [Paenibacillus sp. VKM B-2647]